MLAEFIPRIEFPPAPKLQNDTVWRCHTSFRAAVHYPFEAPEHEEIADYERLEHVGDAILGAEVSLIIHETYPRLVVGLRSVSRTLSPLRTRILTGTPFCASARQGSPRRKLDPRPDL